MSEIVQSDYTFTKVWNINGRLVIADTIKEAVELFKQYAESDTEPKSVNRVFGNSPVTSDALIRED